MPEFKTNLMDADSVSRTLRRLSHEIVEKNKGCDNLCLIGILRRGVPLSKELADNIEKIEGVRVPVGVVDVSLYRDDITEISDFAKVNGTSIDFDITGKRVVMVDDVIYTGRTARAAMEALISLGRPATLQLAVLVDRGHRELPISANFVGKNFPTSKLEMIKVCTTDFDGESKVDLYSI